jgi:hypothetical protein
MTHLEVKTTPSLVTLELEHRPKNLTQPSARFEVQEVFRLHKGIFTGYFYSFPVSST